MRAAYISLVILCLATRVAPAAADTSLLPGWVQNVSGRCGTFTPVRVHFLGNGLSPQVDLQGDVSAPVSMPRGVYGVTVTRGDGAVVEETQAQVRDGNFRLQFGCAEPPASDEPADGRQVEVRFANTGLDCGEPGAVEFRVNGRAAARVGDGAVEVAKVPAGDVIVDVLRGGRRVLTWHVPSLKAGRTLAFGCSDPDAVGEGGGGIPVAFQNSTDLCEAGQQKYLTLWLDGFPVIGLAPGGRTAVRVAAGVHQFEVRVGRTREKMMSGSKDVTGPFRVHFGCGK